MTVEQSPLPTSETPPPRSRGVITSLPSRPDGGAIPPTKEEVKAANSGKLAPRGIQRLLLDLSRNWAVRLGLAGAGAYTTYQTVPEIQEKVDQMRADAAGWWNSIVKFFGPQSIEDMFPDKLNLTDFAPVTKEEEAQLWKNTKTIDLEKHTFTLGFPVNQEAIANSQNIRFNSRFDRSLFIGLNKEHLDQLEKQGIKNINEFTGFSKDTKIYFRFNPAEFDASLTKIAIAGEKQGKGSQAFTPAYTTLLVILRDRGDGSQYTVGLSALRAKPLIDIAPYPTKYHPVYDTGTKITPDTPILELTTDLQDWNGEGVALPGQRGQIEIGLVVEDRIAEGLAVVDPVKGLDPNKAIGVALSPTFLRTAEESIALR